MEMATLLKDSNGVFEVVDEDGEKTVQVNAFNFQEVRFVFPKNIRRALQQRSLAAWGAKLGSTFAAYAFAAFRISFGIFLLISLIIIALAVLAVLLSAKRDGGRGGGLPMHIGRHHGNNLDFWTMYWLMGGNNPFFVAPMHQRRWHARNRRRQAQLELDQPQAHAHQRRIVGGRILTPHEEEDALMGEEEEGADAGNEMGFLDGVFSFLFGDGPPGPSEPERWAVIAAYIRQQSGVVAAEQLLPLLLPLPPAHCSASAVVSAASATSLKSSGESSEEGADESLLAASGEDPSSNEKSIAAPTDSSTTVDISTLAASPTVQQSLMGVLARFGGKPVAVKAEDGGRAILYDFPRLRDLTSPSGGGEFAVEVLCEERWRFSRASESQQAWALGLGALNLVGAMWLRRQASILTLLPAEVASKALLGPTRIAARALQNKEFLARVLPMALKLSWGLQLYAGLFLVIPTLRALYIRWDNSRIDARNAQRKAVGKAVENAASDDKSQLHSQLQCAQSHLASQGI
jgi:hypothetical protein